MNRSPWPVLLILTLAAPGARADDSGPTAAQQAQFDLMRKRALEKQGLAPAAAFTAAVPPPAALPPGRPPPPPQPSFAEMERQRADAFNKVFGDGVYEGIVGFSRRCLSSDGCDKLATMDVIKGGYSYVSLENDVENKTVTRGSGEYKSRDDEIKGGVRGAMTEFHAAPGANPSYESELIKVSDPILKKIFTPEELVQYAQRNAASSDSPNYYTYLGQKLNGAGSPGKARDAFDAALDRNPQSEEALSGRAEAKYELGDFPGAVKDAQAALELNPGDKRALTALKFSEGREAGAPPASLLPGASGALAGADGAAAGAGGAGRAAGASDWAKLAELGRLGAAVSADALRRSDDSVADAKRSMSMGDAKSATEDLRRAVELNPSNAQAYALASMAYSRLKNYEAAFSAAESGLKLAPRNAALLDTEAFALNHLKDYRGALAAADLALSVNPRDAMAYFNRAAALGGLRDRAGMLASLRAAAELDPKFAPILESALQLPEETDILYLFPGEAPMESSKPAATSAPRPWGRIAGRGALAAALLAALLLGFRSRRRRCWRENTSSAARSAPAAWASSTRARIARCRARSRSSGCARRSAGTSASASASSPRRSSSRS